MKKKVIIWVSELLVLVLLVMAGVVLYRQIGVRAEGKESNVVRVEKKGEKNIEQNGEEYIEVDQPDVEAAEQQAGEPVETSQPEELSKRDLKFVVDAPDKVEDTLVVEGSGTEYKIDARIEVPDAEAMNVYRVEPQEWTEENIKAILSSFFGDMQISWYDSELQMENMESDADNVASAILKMGTGNENFSGYALNSQGQQYYFYFVWDSDIYNYYFSINKLYMVGEQNESVDLTFLEDVNQEFDGFSRKEAEKIAREKMEAAGYADYEAEKIQACVNGVYKVTLAKNIDGIQQNTPVYNMVNALEMSEDYQTSQWIGETLEIYLNKDEIVSVLFCNIEQLKGVEQSEAALLPYDDIYQIFKDYISARSQWGNENSAAEGVEAQENDMAAAGVDEASVIVYVDEIKLGYRSVGYAADAGLLIPVWNFTGRMESLDQNGELIEGISETGVAVINAMDGNIID